jgi:hypothetical protein
MRPHFPPPPGDETPPAFPTLPIVTPDPPRLSQRQKYGSLLYLGLGGLVVIATLVGWFAWSAWSLGDVWSNIYALHDPKRPEAERVGAAYALAIDRRVNQRQLWDMCLRRPLPPLARYVLAEALTAEAASADPRGYAMAVSRSEGWPAWLRLLLVRPIAYAAERGVAFPRAPLDELRKNPDPTVGLWATAAVALMDPAGAATNDLEQACGAEGPDRELACLLRDSARSGKGSEAARRSLDRATAWLRAHHAGAAALWAGWEVRDGRLVPRPQPAPELQ